MQRQFRIYTCKKHPHWTLETSAPVIDASLKVVCPLCREEFIIQHIGLPDCRKEMRDVTKQEAGS